MAAKLSIFITSALALAASALPNKPRLCGQVDAPDYMISLQKFPNPNAQGAPGNNFHAAQTYEAGALSSSYANVVSFNGPFGAYGCQLGLAFPTDVQKFYNATGTGGSVNPPTLNVYRLAGPVSDGETRYAGLKKGALFGTVTLRPGQQIINSFACPSNADGGVGFVLEVPEWIQTTEASWSNFISQWDINNSVGAFVNYNC